MISTTTADHGLYIPDLSTTPIIATRCRGDVLVDVATDVVFLPVPPGDVVVVVVLICSVYVPVQLRADEYLLYRWWVSPLQPLMPYELDKQFVSARWTLEDDLMILFLRCRTWLDLTLYIVLIVLLYQNILSVCLSPSVLPHCGCCIYSVFTLHLSCI